MSEPAKLSGWKLYLLLYIGALLLSHLIIWQFESPIKANDRANRKATLGAVSARGELLDRSVVIDYKELNAANSAAKPVVMLLPGGPEGPEVFDRLANDLKTKFRVFIPYLPGYGTPKKKLPSYSFKSLALYTNQLADTLSLGEVHVVGYGLGGASAIHWANRDSAQIASLTLLSSIGVQELELLGSYTLNHAVHSIQLAGVWLLHNAIPHFGLFNALGVNVPYARSFYESDQRPLRSHLRNYRKPMLILHGEDDPLVPAVLAREHHRIVPQSSIVLYQADHDLVETHSDSLSGEITSFIDRVEEGHADSRADVSSEKLQRASQPFSNIDFAKFKGTSLLILMLIIIISSFISEDLTAIGAGLLAARGLIGFWPAVAACFVGIFIGDVGLYLVGRFIGKKAADEVPFKWIISRDDLDNSASWFSRKGPMIIIASRFLPGSRLPTYFSAGVIGAGFWMFITYFLISAVIWTPLLVGISKLLGNELLRYFTVYKDYALWAFLGLLLLLILIAKIIIPAFSYRGRRMLVSRYRRFTRWQHWPRVLLYYPVSCYILYLGVKNRCMTLFTLANPAMPYGGSFRESKSELLAKFDQMHIARFRLLPAGMNNWEAVERIFLFMEEEDLSFPIVLKPDTGHRGRKVQIIHTEQAMRRYINEASEDIIVQEYLEGREYSILYYRMPQSERGQIFSLIAKKLVTVEGDGEKTIEELILDDDHLVTRAKYHLKQHNEQLYELPAAGQAVPIVEIATHARGAILTDAQHLQTQHLMNKLDAICGSANGYYFGRFDLKVPSEEKLRMGEGLKVIDVNGVTFEPIDIYDNRKSFFEAVRSLCRQWKVAFQIGSQNLSQGREAPRTHAFLKHILKTL